MVSVLLNRTQPGSTTPAFSAQTTFVFNQGPRSVAIADFNGDGKPDLVLSDYDYSVSVFLNTTPPGAATPTFTGPTYFNAGTNHTHFALATDINGDGKADIITADFSGNVSVLLNTTALPAAAAT